MARRHPQRDIAGILFVEAEMTLEQIADETDVSITTLSKWKNEDSWGEQRHVKNGASKHILKKLYQRLDKALEENLPADDIVKLSSAIERITDRISPSTAMECFVRLNNYIVKVDAALAIKLLPYEKAIVQEMLSAK